MGFLNKALPYQCPAALYNTPNHTGSAIEKLRVCMKLCPSGALHAKLMQIESYIEMNRQWQGIGRRVKSYAW